jgi:hypothetical protein
VALKKCRVRFSDLHGTGQEVDVDAESLYEGVAKALSILQRNEWSAPSAFEARYCEVSVREPEVHRKVMLKQFEQWLERPGGSPKDLTLRKRIREILES